MERSGPELVAGRDLDCLYPCALERTYGLFVEISDPDGSGVVDLTGSRKGCEREPSFTPDGNRVVFIVQRCGRCRESIWSMNLQGGHRRKIVLAPRASGKLLNPMDPNVSPDGSTLAFVGERNPNGAVRALYTVRMNGRHMERIVPFSFRLCSRSDWAPDGKHLVFTDYRDGPGNTMIVRPDGSGLQQVTHYQGDAGPGGAVFSPDGRWILYRHQNSVSGRFAIWKMRPDGKDRIHVKWLGVNFGHLDWGPRPG
jgi:Tol biopolymer transport system component